VIRQVAPGRFLLDFSGVQVLVESRLELVPGQRLALLVRETTSRVLLDLQLAHSPQSAPAAGEAAASDVASGLTADPAGPSADAPRYPPAHRAVQAACQAELARLPDPTAVFRELREALANLSPGAQPEAAQARSAVAAAAGTRQPALAELAGSIALTIPEPAQPPPADMAPAPAAAQEGAAAQAPPRDQGALAAAIAELVGASPERVAELTAALESRIAAALAALPGARQLDLLIGLLAELGGSEPEAAPAVPGGPPTDTTALLERLLDALAAPAARDDQEAARPLEAVRAQLEALGPRERGELFELATRREASLLSSSADLAALGRAWRALDAARERADLNLLGSAAASRPGAAFTCAELPVFMGEEGCSARLRVLVRREGRGSGRGRDRGAGGPVRAVLDLETSALGQVWSEVLLTGKQLAVRIRTADAARRDYVAERLPELEERLAARGLEARATVEAREPGRAAPGADLWPETVASGRVDLWA
jgi:hypothetical protein